MSRRPQGTPECDLISSLLSPKSGSGRLQLPPLGRAPPRPRCPPLQKVGGSPFFDLQASGVGGDPGWNGVRGSCGEGPWSSPCLTPASLLLREASVTSPNSPPFDPTAPQGFRSQVENPLLPLVHGARWAVTAQSQRGLPGGLTLSTWRGRKRAPGDGHSEAKAWQWDGRERPT